MYGRNSFEHSRRYPNLFPPPHNSAVLVHRFPLFVNPYSSTLFCFHALAHSSRFHTSPNSRLFLVLRTLAEKTGGRGLYGTQSLLSILPKLLTFNFELSTSLPITPIIPIHTSRIAVT